MKPEQCIPVQYNNGIFHESFHMRSSPNNPFLQMINPNNADFHMDAHNCTR